MQDIHPIRPPIAIGLDPALISSLGWILAGCLLALVLFVLIRKWLKNKKNKAESAGLPQPLPPCESAMKALDRLALAPSDDPRTLYFSLTLILRKYIGRTFVSHAAEMTSQEFLRHLSGIDMNKNQKTKIVEFQHFCDPIKYAGAAPGGQKAQSDLSMVRDVIRNIENEQVEKKQLEQDLNPKDKKENDLTIRPQETGRAH